METFEYPVGVLLFNRPHLAKHVLKSLKRSSRPLSEDLLVFHVDGFSGSKNEKNWESNQTGKTLRFIKSVFPRAHVIAQNSNVGIAQSFYQLMSYIFHTFDSEFAVFQEEDVFLGRDYFLHMSKFLKQISPIEKIGAVSINNSDHYQVARSGLIFPTFGTREFALRRSTFTQGQDMYQVYLDSLGPTYREKNIVNVNSALASFKIKLPTAFQDVFQHEMLRSQGKLHLRLNVPGRFDANFANGESIAGFSILQLIKMLLAERIDTDTTSNEVDFEMAIVNLDLGELSQIEDILWKQRVFSDDKFAIDSKQEKLIQIRNFLRVSKLRNMLEDLYLSQILT